MPQQALDHPDVDPLLEQVGGEAVAQGVDGDRLVEPGGLDRLAAGALHRAHRDRPGRVRPREQPGARAGAAPVGAQDREQLGREHDVAVAPALALADADGHPGAVDVGDLEPDHLGDAQAGGVDRGQQRPHPQVGDGGQQAGDLLAGEDGGQRIGLARQRDAGRLLGPVEGDGVEEAQSAHDRADAAGLEPAGDQVQLVVAHVLEGELVRRAAVEGAEAGDRAHVDAARAGGHVAQLHVVEHALPQRRDWLCLCHGDLLSVGLPKPGDPDRRRTVVYGPEVLSQETPKVGKVILCDPSNWLC